MIIDSPIVSGSFLSTGSLSQIGNAQITGSLTVSGSSISLVGGTFSGSGANLFGIPSTGITGLNLSQISSGSVSASISPNFGLLINTRVSASNFTGSFTGSLTGIATSASYAAFALTSSYSLGGSGFPFSGSAVITGSLIVSGSGLTITGSLSVSTLTTGSGVRYVIADANGLISAQTASAAIFTTQQNIATANQTVFPITNGYVTDYLTVFVNGTKLNNDEFTDTDGVNVTFLTGSTAGDIVEFVKYMPAAGVSNNSLRTVNYFTATLGQTNFNVNYTPGLLDVFYNGSKLDNTDYTAANGTSITLATASNAGDRIEVDVYSYQVGAFSGIGGSGAANQLAYFNTSNSITGSNNFVVSGSSIIVTGSLIVSGSGTLVNIGPAIFSGSVTSTGGFSGSFTGSFFGSANSSSLAANSLLLGGTGSVGFTTTGSFTTMSSSLSTRTTQIEQVYATTGSNSFRATQSITGSLTVTGQIIAQTINVQQVTSSIIYSSGSNVFGCDINSRQTFTGSFYQTGSIAVFNSCVGIGTSTPAYILSTRGTGDHRLYHYNSGNTSGDRSIIQVEVCGDTSGNAFFAAGKTGLVWSFGRNTTTGNFEVRSNFDLGNDAQSRLQITPGGSATFSSCGFNVATFSSTFGQMSITFANSGTGFGAIGSGNSVTPTAANDDLGLGTFGLNKNIVFATGTGFSERMRITSGGNIGIGASTNPQNLLEVSAAGGSPRIRVGTLQNNNNTPRIEVVTSGTVSTANSAWLRVTPNGGFVLGQSSYTKSGGDSGNFANLSSEVESCVINVTSAGNVAIGTPSPGAKLDVFQTAGPATSACDALFLRAGNNNTVFCHNQILFGYSGTTDYAHAIKTRHNSNGTADNAIDFFIWRCGDAISTKAGQYVMTIAGNCRVGIGTCTPSTTLDVVGNVTFNNTISSPGNFIATAGLNLYLRPTSGYSTIMDSGTSVAIGFAQINNTASTPLYWNNSNGNLGINTSSRKYKTDIVSLTKEQAEIALQLNPVEYTRIETGERELGFIAEEVKEAGLGLLVPEINGEPLTVDYAKLSVTTIAMIKQQQCTINILKSCLGIA